MACIDPHQTGFAGKGSDSLQLVKCRPSRALGKWVCGGAKFFAPPCSSQHPVFASPSAFLFEKWFHRCKGWMKHIFGTYFGFEVPHLVFLISVGSPSTDIKNPKWVGWDTKRHTFEESIVSIGTTEYWYAIQFFLYRLCAGYRNCRRFWLWFRPH